MVSTTLLINEIVDLEIEENSESHVAETAQAVLSEDLDYDPSEVLNSFLEREKQNRPNGGGKLSSLPPDVQCATELAVDV
ncbi:28982_t:CDS:2 [Gigaspora margarita]|uniref:28982_t:CDS:1 n=1 Tax=Gigaspora margarita TaxID=4874 RepID=A0ABN7VNT1_GIGMA|nr:28982_t:CDS:2 [Gigaspora margarita]